MFNGLSQETVIKISTHDVRKRFWAKVDIRSPEECWPWKPKTGRNGYGLANLVTINSKLHRIAAHRAALMLSDVPVAVDEVVDHVCRNRACCNPSHLRSVTPRVNALENSSSICVENAAKTHCIHGHELPKTTNKYGKRQCLVCRKIRYNEWYKSEDGQRYHLQKYHAKHGYKTKLEKSKAHQRSAYCAFGETKALWEWSEQYGVKQTTIINRIKAGWSVESAIKTPAKFSTRWHKQ